MIFVSNKQRKKVRSLMSGVSNKFKVKVMTQIERGVLHYQTGIVSPPGTIGIYYKNNGTLNRIITPTGRNVLVD